MDRTVIFNRLDNLYDAHKAEYDNAVLHVLASGRYILGDELKAFEQEFARYVGCKYCVGVNSGLDALTLSLRVLDISAGDEVIVPAHTYIATALAVSANGATPVFVDSNEFYCIDSGKIERAITSKTRAIIPVHMYGQACDMDVIVSIAKKYSLFVLEDCAQSHGAFWKDKMTGSYSDLGCFSFFPTKNIGAFGDAGGIVTDNPQWAEKLQMLRNYGSRIKYYNEVEGVNSRMDEVQAALLRVRLRYVEEAEAERRKIAEYYLKNITNKSVQLPRVMEGASHAWHLFVIRTEKRDALQRYLKDRGITTLIHYPIPPYLSEAYRFLDYKEDNFGNASKQAKEVLSLPLYAGMTNDDLAYCVDVINTF